MTSRAAPALSICALDTPSDGVNSQTLTIGARLPSRSRIRASVVGSRWPRRSEEHTSELQSLMRISYAVFCLKKKKLHTTVALESHSSLNTLRRDHKGTGWRVIAIAVTAPHHTHWRNVNM